MNNYEKLSKDELIKLLLEKDIELRDLRIKYDKLILKYDNEHQRQLRDTYNQFVKKSEKLEPIDEAINEAEAKATKKRGQKEGSHNFIYDLKPTRTIIKELDEKDRICPSCGEVMVEIGEDSTKKIIKYPATYEVVEIITKKYACKNPNCDSTVKQAISDDVFGHSPVTPSVVADVINMKYSLGVPLDRYSKYLISKGINLSTQCLSNYVLEAADILNPLYLRLKYELTHNNANVIHADETTLKVLDIADKEKCYMFVYTTTFFDNPVYIYEFSESRKTDKTEELFKDYKGYLVCDRYAGYDKFKDRLAGIQRCMAHARRYFFDVLKGLTPKEAKQSKARLVVEKFDKIFNQEKIFKEKKYTISEIKEKRNTNEYQIFLNNSSNYTLNKSLEAYETYLKIFDSVNSTFKDYNLTENETQYLQFMVIYYLNHFGNVSANYTWNETDEFSSYIPPTYYMTASVFGGAFYFGSASSWSNFAVVSSILNRPVANNNNLTSQDNDSFYIEIDFELNWMVVILLIIILLFAIII